MKSTSYLPESPIPPSTASTAEPGSSPSPSTAIPNALAATPSSNGVANEAHTRLKYHPDGAILQIQIDGETLQVAYSRAECAVLAEGFAAFTRVEGVA